jgi:hypothetical protein
LKAAFSNLLLVSELVGGMLLLGDRLLAYRILTTIVLYMNNNNRIFKNFFNCLKMLHTIHYVSETNFSLLQVKPLVSLEEKGNLLPRGSVWSIFMTGKFLFNLLYSQPTQRDIINIILSAAGVISLLIEQLSVL